MNDRELYKRAIIQWGVNAQVMMVFEEIGELMQSISKYFRTDDREILKLSISEEIADVEIMLGQLKEIIYCHETVEEVKKRKLNKLEKLLTTVK
jgi:NTP pyrophosphatase (non-canonical NTP hydrolase)